MAHDEINQPTFRGFRSPNYTQVPDELFDELLADLSGAEIKVVLYIIRRTFGFKKQSDSISLNQITNGIETHDGEVLDRGTGLSKASVASAVKSLESRGVIVRTRRRSNHKGDEPTTYSLKMINDHPLSNNWTPPGLKTGHPPVQELDTQETVKQQTDRYPSKFEIRKTSPKDLEAETRRARRQIATEDRDNTRHIPKNNRFQQSEKEPTGRPASDLPRGITTPAEVLAARGHDLASEPAPLQRGRPPGSADEREQLRAYLADFARELHDGAPLSSTISRVLNLFREAGLPRERWGDILYQARAITQEHSAQITTPAGEGSSRGIKNKMPYYLAVVESLIGLRDSADLGSEHLSRPRHEDGKNAAKPSFTAFSNRARRSG